MFKMAATWCFHTISLEKMIIHTSRNLDKITNYK
jgi:hypothetical protein